MKGPNAIWAFLQLRTQEWRWNRGVVSGVADSIKGAVLKVGLALGGVILLMFKHVGAILLSPIFERELLTHVWLMRCNCIIIFLVTYTVARVSERDLR